jgi:hypothetical protein
LNHRLDFVMAQVGGDMHHLQPRFVAEMTSKSSLTVRYSETAGQSTPPASV